MDISLSIECIEINLTHHASDVGINTVLLVCGIYLIIALVCTDKGQVDGTYIKSVAGL